VREEEKLKKFYFQEQNRKIWFGFNWGSNRPPGQEEATSKRT